MPDRQPHPTPFDQTIAADSKPAVSKGKSRRRMALVAGTSPELSNEIDDLLKTRLRAASLLLFAGFLAFFIRRLLYLEDVDSPIGWFGFWDHFAMTVLTGFVGIRLCTDCEFILKRLRVFEVLVFGGSALFFLFVSYTMLERSAERDYLHPIVPMWMLLIFTYALFIPNTFRRACAVLISMAAAPILLVTAMSIFSPQVREVMATNTDFRGYSTEVAMMISLSTASAIWGASTIGALRRREFEARRLGQYRLKEKIGEGGMGEVYLAEHMLLKRPCALKLIRPDKAGETRVLARFEREVKATAKLSHWNSIEIYDYGRADDGTFYYVMEYLPGLNLGQLVEIAGPLPSERMIHLIAPTCDALDEAHEHGLIHRDIKPANIFAARRGGIDDVAKLLDFGLAKPLSSMTETAVTMEGAITGSPMYMSPEQVTGDGTLDRRSDIYSLGVVAYQLLTGEPPFTDERPLQLMLAHAREEPVPPSQLNPHVPEDVEQVILRCLEKDPDDRFQDAVALKHALLSCESAGRWTDDDAAGWWNCSGCPHKKELDDKVLQAVTA